MEYLKGEKFFTVHKLFFQPPTFLLALTGELFEKQKVDFATAVVVSNDSYALLCINYTAIWHLHDLEKNAWRYGGQTPPKNEN